MTGSSSSTVSEPAVRRTATPRALYAAMATSSVGSVLNTIALLAYLYQRTSSPLPVGGAVLVNFLPVVLIVPLIGARLTGHSLRLAASAAAFGQAALVVSMALVVAADGPLLPLYVASAALGVLTQLLWISILSLLPGIVAPARLASTNIAVQLASQTGAVVGALALVGHGPAAAWVLFAIDAATFVVQGVVLWVMLPPGERAPDPVPAGGATGREATGERPGEPARVARGLTARERGYGLLMPVGFIAMNVLNVAVPLIILDSFGDGQRQYALTETVYPVAAIAVGALLRRRFRVPAAAGIAVIGAAFVVLGLAGSVPVLLVAVALFGASIIVSNAATQTLVQSNVARERLPRVQSFASATGATLSALAIIAVTAAFDRRAGGVALVVVGVGYLVAAPMTFAIMRRRVAAVDEQTVSVPR
jgi:hypothetical protein